jgi:hypothetical protein
MNIILSLAVHYLYGLFAQSWQGGITAISVIVKEFAEGKLASQGIWVTVWHAFISGVAVNAFLYLYAHPLPAALPPGIADTPMARLRQATNPAAVLVPSQPAKPITPTVPTAQ